MSHSWPREVYWRKEPSSPALLAAMTRSLVAADQFDLLGRLVDHTLARPEQYPLIDTHVAGLIALQPWLAKHVKKSCPPLARWIEACCAQLESLTTQEPQPPADFRCDAPITSRNADALELKRFLEDPRESVHRFRVEGGRRDALEHLIRHHRLDLTAETERKGRPYTLLCTKTTASYEARLKKYHEDLGHLATLRAIEAKLPG